MLARMSEGSAITDDQIVRSTLEIALQPVRISIGPASARLNWRMVLTNAGEAQIVALRVWSDCKTSRFAVPDPDDFSGPDTLDARLHNVRMLPPGETVTLSGEWQIKRADFVPFIGITNQILGLARIRIVGAGILPAKALFLVGKQPAQDDAQPEAMTCDGALQVHSNLVARLVRPNRNESNIASDSDAA